MLSVYFTSHIRSVCLLSLVFEMFTFLLIVYIRCGIPMYERVGILLYNRYLNTMFVKMISVFFYQNSPSILYSILILNSFIRLRTEKMSQLYDGTGLYILAICPPPGGGEILAKFEKQGRIWWKTSKTEEKVKKSAKNREEFLEEGGKIFSGWPEYIALLNYLFYLWNFKDKFQD